MLVPSAAHAQNYRQLCYFVMGLDSLHCSLFEEHAFHSVLIQFQLDRILPCCAKFCFLQLPQIQTKWQILEEGVMGLVIVRKRQ